MGTKGTWKRPRSKYVSKEELEKKWNKLTRKKDENKQSN